MLQFPDGRLMNDSTPLAYALEREHPGARSIVPDDPVQAYLSDLLEDFGDEWVTKMMFHYRWYYAADRDFAQTWIVTSRDPVMPEGPRRAAMQAFNDRQVGRMAMVGCTEQNRPIIEDSYRFVLDTLDRHVRAIPFLFGSRPVARRLRPVRPAPDPVGRSHADGRDARAGARRLLLAAAARRCLGHRGRLARCGGAVAGRR